MTEHADNPGARLIRLETEVPGTPEQVWRAIATTEGLTTWYLPSTVEEREGGAFTSDMGPWGKNSGVVTAYDAPHRFAFAETGWHPDPEAPAWATEILVEARDGGTCVVRLVSGFLENGEAWEDMMGGAAEGFTQALENLRLYLTHFAGLPGCQLTAAAVARGEVEEVRARLLAHVGLAGAVEGATVTLTGSTELVGLVETVEPSGVLVRVQEPVQGLWHARVWPGAPGDVVMAIRAILYGENAAEVAPRDERAWQAWLYETFPDAVAPE